MNVSPLLEVKNLTISYRVSKFKKLRAIDNVSFKVFEKEIVAIVGESGCGKSTLGLAILKILPENAIIENGSIIFEGKDLLKLNENELRNIRGSKISIIFQDPSSALNPVMRICDHVIELIKQHRKDVSKEEAIKLTIELFEKLGIPRERVWDYPHQLSGGMKQRVCIALAIALKPKLVIADEPTTALDVITQDQILELFKQLRQEYNTSFLFITHDLSLVADLADRVIIMYGGEIVEQGYIDQVFYNSKHPYTQSLLKCIPSINERNKLEYIPGELPDLTNSTSGCKFYSRCRYAIEDRCNKLKPPEIEIENGHTVKCWLVYKR